MKEVYHRPVLWFSDFWACARALENLLFWLFFNQESCFLRDGYWLKRHPLCGAKFHIQSLNDFILHFVLSIIYYQNLYLWGFHGCDHRGEIIVGNILYIYPDTNCLVLVKNALYSCCWFYSPFTSSNFHLSNIKTSLISDASDLVVRYVSLDFLQRDYDVSRFAKNSLYTPHTATLSLIIQGLAFFLWLILHTIFHNSHILPILLNSGQKSTITIRRFWLQFPLPSLISVRCSYDTFSISPMDCCRGNIISLNMLWRSGRICWRIIWFYHQLIYWMHVLDIHI